MYSVLNINVNVLNEHGKYNKKINSIIVHF